MDKKYELATIAGGCFWCIESVFNNHKGIISAVSGYAGGEEEDAKYDIVSGGNTGHREAVQVTFDPELISYEVILRTFIMQIDPTDVGGQFADRGYQYTTAVYYHSDEQRKIAEREVEKLKNRFDVVNINIEPYISFFEAEEYHQDYAVKFPEQYERYVKGSGRKDYIKENWSEGLQNLNPMSYHVLAEDGTELPFNNEYWDNKEEGIYVDVLTGKPLFSSVDKFDSGTGWPSFTSSLDNDVITQKDTSYGMERTEVRSESGHLGHVFDDGPEGKPRYCINSAALRFIPRDKMEEEGYGEYLKLFN